VLERYYDGFEKKSKNEITNARRGNLENLKNELLDKPVDKDQY